MKEEKEKEEGAAISIHCEPTRAFGLFVCSRLQFTLGLGREQVSTRRLQLDSGWTSHKIWRKWKRSKIRGSRQFRKLGSEQSRVGEKSQADVDAG